MQVIPLSPDSAHQDLLVELDGKPYKLQVRYNQRADHYELNVSTENGVSLLMGVVVSLNRDMLLRVYHRPEHPGGILTCVAMSGDDSTPKFGELGTDARCRLVYWSLSDVYGALI